MSQFLKKHDRNYDFHNSHTLSEQITNIFFITTIQNISTSCNIAALVQNERNWEIKNFIEHFPKTLCCSSSVADKKLQLKVCKRMLIQPRSQANEKAEQWVRIKRNFIDDGGFIEFTEQKAGKCQEHLFLLKYSKLRADACNHKTTFENDFHFLITKVQIFTASPRKPSTLSPILLFA